ncbi:conserved protein [Methanothermobacter thermautotrophicus str. Delta H]|uniref:UPF0147 protein MTH_1407 n=3 Tax=Methanothermobacter TaxID=145260 RepID=Y1407_METTH|nr:RecName: Full=UPF0147 protein MTH_1407 [Methanothermobacter thermautotrophicus str. Delta H]AAB85884.1 conserved protein [Methanothermobacter thermautotrophicus str. Delta H]
MNINIILYSSRIQQGGLNMSNETFNRVSEILRHIMEDNSVPRNIRRAAEESNEILNNPDEDSTVRASTVISILDEISNDPNIPIHARTLVWEILSELESIRE